MLCYLVFFNLRKNTKIMENVEKIEKLMICQIRITRAFEIVQNDPKSDIYFLFDAVLQSKI